VSHVGCSAHSVDVAASMFPYSSSVSYEGLPFVSGTQLRTFLAYWGGDRDGKWGGADSASGLGDARTLLVEYFRSQEAAYHTLLDLVSEVSRHLDFWLNWTTPVRQRPVWVHRLKRRLWAKRLTALGRSADGDAPGVAARHLARVHGELYRLLAYLQVSSLNVLSSDHSSIEERALVLSELSRSLAVQATAARRAASALDILRPTRRSTSTAVPDVTSNGSLVAADVAVSSSLVASPLPPLGTRSQFGSHESLFRSPFHDRSPSLSRDNSRTVLGDSDHSFKEALGLSTASDPVAIARAKLNESRLAVADLATSLHKYLACMGRPRHLPFYWPLYASATFSALSWIAVVARDSGRRAAFMEQVHAIVCQFYREWVKDPLQELFLELFRRLSPSEENVSLQDLVLERAALSRMLEQFAEAVKADPGSVLDDSRSPAAACGQQWDDSDIAERYFERSLANPLIHVVHGHLLASCMVQCQRLKVLLYSSMHSIDAVMLQLKWDFLMAGVVPMLSLCFLGHRAWVGFLGKRRLKRHREMVRALSEVDRFLNRNSQALLQACRGHHDSRRAYRMQMSAALLNELPLAEKSGCASCDCLHTPSRRSVSEPCSDGQTDPLELEKVGAWLSHLDALCRLASRARVDDADWRAFRRDILDLASPELSVQQKLHVAAAMRSTCHVFHLDGGV